MGFGGLGGGGGLWDFSFEGFMAWVVRACRSQGARVLGC